jgi:hypothetical protein
MFVYVSHGLWPWIAWLHNTPMGVYIPLLRTLPTDYYICLFFTEPGKNL